MTDHIDKSIVILRRILSKGSNWLHVAEFPTIREKRLTSPMINKQLVITNGGILYTFTYTISSML